MTAYAVGLYNMHRYDWLDAYRASVPGPIARQGGRYLIRGRTCRWEMLEGKRPDITGLTIIEFPSMEAGRAWHADRDYRPFIELRQSASQLDLMLVEDPTIR